jgi:hypothetical protein
VAALKLELIMITPPAIAPLNTRQTLTAIILGVVLWLAAAILLNALSETGVHDGSSRLLLYLAIIPGTAPFVLLIDKVAGLSAGQTGMAVSLAVGAATLLDGTALAWAPALYGGIEHVDVAGSAILWGAGVAIALAFSYDRLRTRT